MITLLTFAIGAASLLDTFHRYVSVHLAFRISHQPELKEASKILPRGEVELSFN